MKKLILILTLCQISFASASSYLCKLKVKNSQVNLDSEFIFNGDIAIKTSLGDYNFDIFESTQSTGEVTYIIGIGNSYGASSTVFTPGSELVAHAVNSGEQGAIVQAVCRLQ